MIDSPLLDVPAVAVRLDVCEDTVYGLIARKKLAAHRVGRLLRVSEASLAAYLERSQTAKSMKARPKPDLSGIPEYV